ncbi:UNVERIFIED_CONTAM: protein SHORT ROOT IN SALT MEDIUM 1 [Sesamum angustifolium]|uniref:Protein SHORT ROOT IN SALT MEDIUM 1 n=1 Tax=Sesamum angustifolium TaxID=2727405 RepID=A0AAW2M8B3_9LAMI
MAIGGPWDTVDGGDPSVDDSSLVRTALRYAKDVTNLDLKNCQHWHRFLEIHYERVGKDGLFSHKEVTVLYVPDLSECLPSLDSWRDQWLNHKKAVSDRELLYALKKEIPGEKEEGPKDKKKPEHLKDSAGKSELQKKKESTSSGQSGDDSKKEKSIKQLKASGNLVSDEGKEKDKAVGDKGMVGSTDEEKNVVKTGQGGNSTAQIAVGAKPGKKKIIKRIVKKKVAKKKDGTETATEQNDELDKEVAGGKNVISEVDGQQDGSSSTPVIKTFVRKKIVKKPVASTQEKDETAQKPEGTEDEAKVKSEDSNVVVQEGGTKTTVKKKVVKRVPKRKAVSAENDSKVAEDSVKGGEKIIQPEDIKGEQNEESAGNQMNKIQSLSLSLDSLLDYSDKDTEESTFELSLFAESFYEMLQYEMGCRLLAFLQKLRIKFVAKRNQGKRQRADTPQKENEESSPRKRVKTDKTIEESKSAKTENTDDVHQGDSKISKEETDATEQVDEAKMDGEIDEEDAEEDPEEDPEENEEMPEAIPHHEPAKEEADDAEKNARSDAVGKDVAPTEQNEQQETAKQTSETISSLDPSNKDKLTKAFRFFDRNRVGYIRVEDLRLIIHNLGKFLSHRDVKELVQSALLESNTGRDDRILYDKLVKMSDI